MPETKAEAEALLPHFTLVKLLSQDQQGRRINLLGTIHSQQAILTLERSSLPSDPDIISTLISTLSDTTNLGANDIYRWYMSNAIPSITNPNVKVNIIWPCTENHVRKYTTQKVRYVTETAEVYSANIKPWIQRTQRTQGRVGWIYNILDGITEQEDVVHRSEGFGRYERLKGNEERSDSSGFLLLPDLNWDRKSVEGLHLLALVERRDLWSLRSLKRGHARWLRGLRGEVVRAAAGEARRLLRVEREGDRKEVNDVDGNRSMIATMDGQTNVDVDVDEDQFKCYVHYQPTYYHFHVHVVHVMLEAGATQAVGKAFSLDLLIAMLEALPTDDDGLEQMPLTYSLGEENELWKKCFGPLKRGEKITLNDG